MALRSVGPAFEIVGRFRPFELLSPGFVEARSAPGDRAGREGADALVRSTWSPPAPYVTVEALVPGDTGRSAATVLAGLASTHDEHLLAAYDVGTGTVSLEIRTGGLTTVLAGRRLRGRADRLCLVVCENQATVFAGTARGLRPVLTERRRIAPRLDLRVPATLRRLTAAWGTRGGPPLHVEARAGLFGMVGLRDLHLVQHADGTAYTEDGRVFLTATCAGPGFFRQAHWGVFALDPDAPDHLEQTAHLFSLRDGRVYGDHAGQLVRDGDRWLVATSSWGDFTPGRGVHVRHAVSGDDLLRGVHVLATRRLPLPADVSTWDPGMTRIDGRWHVSFVESPSQDPFVFHPALAAGPPGAADGAADRATDRAADRAPESAADGAADWSVGLQRLGSAEELTQCEGPVLAEPHGRGTGWRLLASDGNARRYPVFDLAMNRVGVLDAPYGSNIPHPQLVEPPGRAPLLVTFDGRPYARRTLGYGTHGDVVVMRAATR